MAETKITIDGNIVGDPELRFIPSGAAVAKFTVASTPRVKNGDQWEDGPTTFLPVTVWREWAEGAAETLRKGDNVIVVGKLKQRSYEDKDQVKRTVYEIDGEFIGKSVRARKPRDAGQSNPGNDSGW